MRWIAESIRARRAVSLERHRRRLAEQRAEVLAEMLDAARDTIAMYQAEHQARTAVSIAQREALRHERGYRP